MDKKKTEAIWKEDLRIYPLVRNSALRNKNKHKEKVSLNYLSDTSLQTPETLKHTLPAKTKFKKRKTVSFKNNADTPDSRKIPRECTPYKLKLTTNKLDRKSINLKFNLSPNDKCIFEKESNCGSLSMSDSSFVSSVADSSMLLPSFSEFDKIKNKNFKNPEQKKINKKTRKRKLETAFSSDSLSDSSVSKDKTHRPRNKIKKYKKRNANIDQHFTNDKVVKKQNIFEINDTSSKYFDVDEVHFEGEIRDPLIDINNDSQKENDNVKDIFNINAFNVSSKVKNIDINVWNNNYPKTENSPKQINETYADFCSTLDTSVGNVSLEDSVFASDIYSQNETSFSISSTLDENDVQIEPNFSSSDNSVDDDNVARLKVSKDDIEDPGEILNGFCSPSPLIEPCNGFIKPPEVYESEELQTAVANFFQLDNSVIIVIKPDSRLYFHGYLSVTVLQGAVEVLGYKLSPNSKPANIYSPRGSGYLYFETIEENNIADLDAHPKLKELHSENSSLEELLKDCQLNDVILYCETFENSSLKFMEKYIPQPFFPKPDESGLRCVFKDRIDNWNVFEPNEEWEYLRNVNVTDKIFICGGKGVGKSTMLRYCVNSLLGRFPKVLVIDLDPGQPELTLPGCVSAVVIDEPIFGPSFTQLRRPKRSFFVSNIDVSDEPREYLNAVKEIVMYTKTLSPMVTCVNYMGYSKGLGVDLAASVIALLNPTILVQIESKHVQRNFKDNLMPEFVENRAKLFLLSLETSLNYQYIPIRSVTDGNKKTDVSAKQLREMRIFWYFGTIVKNSLNDKTTPVYEIGLSDIKIIHNKKIVPPLVINGNLVCLCHKEEEYESYICVGWGIVRAVDLINDKLYLITPVLSEDLELVDHIILGSIFLPSTVYLSDSSSRGLIPYVAQGVLNIFGEIPKRIQEYNRRKFFVH